MISRKAFFGIAVFALIPGVKAASAAGIDVLAWELQTQVELPGLANDGDGSGTPTNPFQETQSASAGISTAQSIFDVSWDAAGFFDFLIETEQVGQGHQSGFVRSKASFDLIPAVDSVLTIEGEYAYDLGNGDRESELAFSIWEAGVARVLSVSHLALPIAGDPRQGTFVDQATVPLDAGVHYDIGGFMILRSFGGSPTSLSLGDGHLRFSIVPVPEPHSAFLLVLAAAACHSRRRRGLRP